MSTPVAFTPAEGQLVFLMNETFNPPKSFDNTRITFGEPVAVTASDHDTEMEVDSIPGMGYYGSAIVMYTRLNLSVLEGQINLFSLQPFTLAMICTMMNAQYDTFLDASDLVPPTIPTLSPGNSETITLTAVSTSTGYTGSVDIVLTYGKPQLNAVISQKRLAQLINSNFVTTQFGAGFLNGKTFLWNIDFTSYRESLAVTTIKLPPPYYGYAGFANPAQIADICTKLGVPTFPAPGYVNQVGDYATSAVPDSNQNFDRVVIMGYVPGGSFYPGPLYFHYNQFDKA